MDTLPPPLRAKAEKILREGPRDAAEVIEHLFLQLSSPITPKILPKASTPPLTSFSHKWPLSQLFPQRKAVLLAINSSQIATFSSKDGELSVEGDFSTYNVFLKLPLPKRPKPQTHLVFTKLGGNGPFLVLSSPDPPPDLLSTVIKHCKYADVSAVSSQAVPAYIKAQEGLLYLLEDFLFFGFKKPLVLILVAEIESVSFTMVTSRTFSIVVKRLDGTCHEFEKISHEYHEQILAYNERHNLDDESMSESRRSKRLKTEPSVLLEALNTPNGGHPSGGHPSGGRPSGGHPSGGRPNGGQIDENEDEDEEEDEDYTNESNSE